MSNVLIDRQKIDILANAISDKSGVPVTMTLDEMVEAVDSIETGGGEPNLQAKTYNVSSAGTVTVTADSGYDGLSSVNVSVPQAEAIDYNIQGQYVTEADGRKYKFKPLLEFTDGYVSGWQSYNDYGWFLAVPSNTSITPTESSQTIGGANYMMEGAVTVNAIPSNYVGSGITRRDSTDLSASGATVTVPSGYYSAQASTAVASGTAGTPTATKGAVSNHSISVTPSVTNTAGYISGGTINGTAVSVSASELVSGTYNVTSSGTKDVTNYASASVPSGTEGTPTASKGAVSNHAISVTPSVTNTTGFITGSTKTGTAVTVSASELVSGSETKTENGTYDVTNLAELVVDVQGGSVTWETIYNGNVTIVSDSPNYVVINNFTDPPLRDGQTWRVTWNGTQYICPVEIGTDQAQTRFIGNKGIVGYTGDDSNEPFFGYMRTSTQLAFVTTDSAGTIPLKMELQQSSSATLIEKTITANGTYDAEDDDADGYSSVTVNVPSGTSKNVQVLQSTSRTNSSSLTKVLGDLTVSKTGTYDIYWSGGRSNTSTSYTWGTRLYVDGSGYGTENTTWTNNCQSNHLSNVSLTANQKLSVYARGRSGSYYTFAPMLVIIEA